jgi:hypothetical protein
LFRLYLRSSAVKESFSIHNSKLSASSADGVCLGGSGVVGFVINRLHCCEKVARDMKDAEIATEMMVVYIWSSANTEEL